MKDFISLEAEEQAVFVSWLEQKGLKFTAIPNSTYTTSFKQKRKNHVQGLRPGFPDLVIALPRHLICIEMKRKKGGRVSPEQKDWIDVLDAIPNVGAYVCNGADEAIKTVEDILNTKHENT